MKNLVVLSGAGMSAESGISTFRDANGLWEGHDIYEVASWDGWMKNPNLVLEFYNKRRAQLKTVEPNEAHLILAALEKEYNVQIITQNVDDLHERAGSTHVLHLHGELRKVRSTIDDQLIYTHTDDLHLGDLCEKGSQLRPHIVWFGEAVPMIQRAIELVSTADILITIGTSLQVYPAAGLIHYTPAHTIQFYIDNNPASVQVPQMTVIPKTATEGMKELNYILSHL
jgi:NAD-dependent deacetylase